MMRRLPPAFAGLLVLAFATMVRAHAHLETASPPPSGTVAAAPAQVSIDFTEAVEPQYSSIVVHDADDRPVTVGTADTAPGNPRRLAIRLVALSPGTYRVIWHVTAADMDRTQGTYEFTVQP